MVKKIFTGALLIYFFAGAFCGQLLSLEKGSGAGAETQCDPSSITTYNYLMTFHVCTGDQCNQPQYHMVHLAGSDDGLNWSLIEGFEPFSGSVPDIVFYNNALYIYHTGTWFQWHKLNACFEVVEEGEVLLEGDDAYGFVDPSMIVDGENLIMVYLPGVGPAGNPAGCNEYPCTKEIHSAVAADDSISSFIQDDGYLASMYIENRESEIQLFCDPDILKLQNGTYLLYVSTGGGALVYQSTTLTGIFVSPDDPNLVTMSSVGGVPSAIQAPDGSVWLYVNGYNPADGGVILRGVSSDGITPINENDFEVAISHVISNEFSDDAVMSSPSIIEWPEWVTTTSTTSTINPTTTTTMIPTTTTTSLPQPCPAESIYGEHSREADLLRHFRDGVLSNTTEGQEMIKFYYALSPVVVSALEENPKLREEVKGLIDGIVAIVNGE